ncbi:MAG: 3-hydroxyacyl-CoA dehydrogenase NAD-binding domain-containing protein [Bacteroidota bacterium]|nr:3-hydroxyacyl-CoA dehydrogenase NAD-binding domain-containing protein [Bacteroidota bacterium]
MESLVCICGAGTMGRGITLAAARQGVSVILYDLSRDMISDAARAIELELEQELQKKRISATEQANIIGRILFSSEISDCRAPLIIEAIIEKTEVKSALFLDLARFNTPETIFASNTSSLSITAIAEQTPFPERVIGLHFFNPANRMKLVEIIRTKYVSDSITERIRNFAVQLGKTSVICRDAPGFIVNHVARPFYLGALRLAEDKKADMATIDKLMEAAGFKMGPFHLMDLIGNDINYTVSCSVYEALGRPARLKPSPLQEYYVKQGLLGKKTGSGFFPYTKPAAE